MILDFQTNSLTTVTQMGPGLWGIVMNVGDNLLEVSILLEVKAPTLDIRKSEILVKRDVLGAIPDMTPAADKLIGVRVGPGMTKIVRELVGGPNGSSWVADLVLEAMEMLVNAITVPELAKAAQTGGEKIRVSSDGPKIFLNDVVIGPDMIKVLGANPRLKDSCAAFQNLE
ncbi:MAG: DUF2889 domain-containing protein [Deltaproteobacteria bacterium]|nr:DUF2889 domain-containing protein [Deltaproteobacteria bacterium]